MSIIVRTATEDDVTAIRDIYNYEVLNGVATFDTEEKSLEDRLQWFRETSAHPYAVIVAEDGGEVLGWGCLRPFGSRAAYRFTVEDSVYVHQDHRGKGIGRALLARLIEIARDDPIRL